MFVMMIITCCRPRPPGLAGWPRREEGWRQREEGGREGGRREQAGFPLALLPAPSLQPLGSAEMKGAGGFPLLNSLVVLEGLV